MTLDEIKPGDRLTWMHQPRGGYCVPYAVNAEVVSLGKTRVWIRVHRQSGEPTEVSVLPKSLRPRLEA